MSPQTKAILGAALAAAVSALLGAAAAQASDGIVSDNRASRPALSHPLDRPARARFLG